MKSYTKPKFIPIGIVLQTAITHVLHAFSMLFRLMLVRWMIEGMLLGISVSLFLTAGSGSMLSHAMSDQTSHLSSYLLPFTSVNTTIFLLGTTIILVLYFIVLCMVHIATIFAVSKKHRSSLAVLFHESYDRFLPFVTSQILCFFLIVGGFFALILPGIGMLLFFSFVPYVVLFERKNGFSAIERSVQLIAYHPFLILGRISLLWFIWLSLNLFLISSVFQSLGLFPHIALMVVLNMCLWWYSSAYMYLLYKESVSKITVYNPQPIRSHLALSFCGWGIAVFFIVVLYSVIKTMHIRDIIFITPPLPVHAQEIPSLESVPTKEL